MRVPSNILPARLEAVPSLNERRLIKLTDTGAVGLRVGEAVGFLEGAHVGDTVGFLEGLAVGVLEGIVDGLTEGLLDGLVEGIRDGLVEGLAEGLLEGISVGVAWRCFKEKNITKTTEKKKRIVSKA
jgi:uncharacterized protein YkvS